MKQIWLLFRSDWRRATSNTMAIIVLIGLVAIPSLFTWFNVIASWDPFANTKNLKVAVANTDRGYESALIPVRVNVGDQVVAALRANEDLDWVVTNEDEAIERTRSGEFYAAIVIPGDFSEQMLTFYAPGSTRTEILYYTNEKENPLASKITGQGADEVTNQINSVFTETVSDLALALVSSLSSHLEEPEMQTTLARVEGQVGSVAVQLRGAADTAGLFSTLIGSSQSLAESAQKLIDNSEAAFEATTGAVGQGTQAAGNLKDALNQTAGAISSALTASLESYDALADRVDELFTALDSSAAAQVGVIDSLASQVQTQSERYEALKDTLQNEVEPSLPETAKPAFELLIVRIDAVISAQQSLYTHLQQASSSLSEANSQAQANHQAILSDIDQIKAAVAEARTSYETDLEPALVSLTETLEAASQKVGLARDELTGVSSGITGSTDSVVGALGSAEATISDLAESLDGAADTFEGLQSSLSKALESGNLSQVAELIGSDPEVLAAALAQPIGLERTAVFPVVAFGAAMTPLYTTLSLWVGALLIAVSIKVGVGQRSLPGQPELKPHQKYLGRYGIFAAIGLMQSTLVCAGDIFFVGIQPQHPWLFMLAGWLTSLVFTLTVYTLVLAFGNAGKAIGVLLLVIQISGSGGAYPLQLLPGWFQAVSPFLPAAHTINAMRAAIAGTYNGDYWLSMLLLALFIVPALLLGLVLRKPLIGFNDELSKALESTKVM